MLVKLSDSTHSQDILHIR